MNWLRWNIVIGVIAGIAGCAEMPKGPPPHASVAPATQPSVSLALDRKGIAPMYRELLAVDLPTVVRVAKAQNLDIQTAREHVEANRGKYESSVEAIFPVVAPALAYNDFHGVGQNANGTLTPVVHFNNLLPAVSIEWVLNPGTVVYDMIAAKRRFDASAQQEQSIVQKTTRTAVLQYYDLILAQAQLQTAHQSVTAAEELLRITELQIRTGTGLPADEARAQAQLAGFQQDVIVALNNFYQASVALTLTLHLDPAVTLVPAAGEISQVTLVRDDIPVEELLATAVKYRPDLAAAQSLHQAAKGDEGSTIWGGVGPELQAAYTANAIKTHVGGHEYDWKSQQKAGVGASFALGASTFGNIKTAEANQRLAAIDVQRQADVVRASIIAAQQNSEANAKLIPVAAKQLAAAREALRLVQANLQAGTALLIDVLQAQSAADDAMLRYVSAVVRYDQSQVTLLAEMGLVDQLDAKDLPPSSGRSKVADPAGRAK